MNRLTLTATLIGTLSLGVGTATTFAQSGYNPGYPVDTPPPSPYATDNSPGVPRYPDAYAPPARPYAGGYEGVGGISARPSYSGGVGDPAGSTAAYPVVPQAVYPPVGPAAGLYGNSPSAPGLIDPRGYSFPAGPPQVADGDGSYLIPGSGVGFPGPSPLVSLAGQLVGQVDDFLRAFTPNARVVPQGRQFLADASSFRASAARLQQLAANGAPPAAVAAQFGAVAASWHRFESRMERVARGRMGPNIAKILQMGTTVNQIQGFLP